VPGCHEPSNTTTHSLEPHSLPSQAVTGYSFVTDVYLDEIAASSLTYTKDIVERSTQQHSTWPDRDAPRADKNEATVKTDQGSRVRDASADGRRPPQGVAAPDLPEGI